MGRSLMKAGAIIAGAALIATGIGAAAGVGLLGASAGALAASGGAWTLFGVSLTTLTQVGAGLTLVGNLTTKRPNVQTGGSPVQQAYDPQAGIPYPMGRTAVAGRIIYGTTTGENNKYRLHYAVLGGGGPHEAIEGYYANNELVSFTANGGEGASGKYLNRMWQRRRLGEPGDDYLRFTATGSKDTPADHGGNPPEWTPQHLLGGYAVSLTAMEYDTKVYAGDIQPLYVGRWAKVYDPRLDSTYPGGSGPCRPLVESTYVYSENPWCHALTFGLGRWQNGKRVLGFGFPLASIIVSQFVEAANIADANNWKIGGTVYSTDEKLSAMQAMAQAGGGQVVPMGAQVGCVVNAPRVSLNTVRARDIIGQVSVAGSKGRRDRINRVIPRYRSEAHGWEMVSGAAVAVATHVAEDGAQRTREVDYLLVQDVDHASVLARYDIENSREFEPIVLRLKPRWIGYLPGDCITVDVPELGLNGQDVLILRRSFDPANGAVTLECRSETEAKQAFALGRTGTAPLTPGLTGVDYTPAPPAAENWSMVGSVQAGPGGSLPVIVLTGVIDNVHATAVIVDYRQVFDTDPISYGPWSSREWPTSSLQLNADGDPEVKLELTGLAPGGTYQVRVRYRTVRGVEDPDQNLPLGETPVGGVDAGSIYNKPGQEVVDEMAATLRAAINLTNEQLGQLVRERGILDQLNLIGFVTPDGKAIAINETILKLTDGMSFAQFRQALTASFGELTASIGLILEVSAAPGNTYATGSLVTDVLGRITGVKVHNNGHIGQFIVVSDEIHFVDPDDTTGATSVEMLSYVGGKWVLSGEVYIQKLIVGSVETDGIQDHAVGDTMVTTYSTSTPGTGAYVQMPLPQVLDFDYPATLVIDADLAFKDGGGNGPSYHEAGLKIVVNGDALEPREESGVTATQTLNITRAYSVPAGAVTVELYARAKPDDYYTVGNLITRWNFK